MNNTFIYFIFAFAITLSYTLCSADPPLPTDRLLAAGPNQIIISDARSFDFKDFKITPLARYQIEARLISKVNYRFLRDAKISPFDYFLGWKMMSNPNVYSKIKLAHGRTYQYSWKNDDMPISHDEIIKRQTILNHLKVYTLR